MSKQSHIHSHTIVPLLPGLSSWRLTSVISHIPKVLLTPCLFGFGSGWQGSTYTVCSPGIFFPYPDLLTSQINLCSLPKAQDISIPSSLLFWEWLLKVPPKVQCKKSSEMPGIHHCLLCFSDPLVYLHSLTGFKWSHFTSSSFHPGEYDFTEVSV